MVLTDFLDSVNLEYAQKQFIIRVPYSWCGIFSYIMDQHFLCSKKQDHVFSHLCPQPPLLFNFWLVFFLIDLLKVFIHLQDKPLPFMWLQMSSPCFWLAFSMYGILQWRDVPNIKEIKFMILFMLCSFGFC